MKMVFNNNMEEKYVSIMLFAVNIFAQFRSWTTIVEQFKAINEQTFFLMNRSKQGYSKFDSVNCLIMKHFDSISSEQVRILTTIKMDVDI
jgi:hypothetical protein